MDQIPSRLLLDKKAMKKDLTNKNEATNGLTNVSSPSHSTRTYDPRTLLNPKGPRKAVETLSKAKGSQTALMSSPSFQSNGGPERISSPMSSTNDSSGSKVMLEDLYGVERRVDAPRKKVKTNEDTSQSSVNRSSHSHSGNGIIGSYMRPDPQEGSTAIESLIDLTKTDDEQDDDDIEIVESRKVDPEVCFGHVNATVHAHFIPKPKTESMFGSALEWPVMKCTLVRRPAKDTVIEVIDPTGATFGRIDSDLATVLAPAMDGLKGLRTQARLTNRKKKYAGELAHQSCSDKLRMIINIYGRRSDVERVGRVFGQHNIWFRPPMAAEPGIPVVNPHAQKAVVVQQSRGGGRNVLSDTRTLEEATEAVSKLFDSFADARAVLNETETPAAIKTPLLSHQKQALTFLLRQEQPRSFGEEESENSSLWRRKRKANGQIIYREVVSGLAVEDEPDQLLGGLLADVMGLGKTLEALSLVASTLQEAQAYGQLTMGPNAQESYEGYAKGTLIVCPTSTVKNWEDQIREHVEDDKLTFYVYHGQNRTRKISELKKYDIVIATYGVLSSEFSGRGVNGNRSPVAALNWFRIILDEAHTIREPRATQSQAMYNLWAERRWCLTGTPIQNRIDDLGSLTRFLRMYPYDTAARFNQYIRAPAQAGDPSFLKALRVFVDSFTLRRLRDRVNLPPRRDLIERLKFSPDEQKLHDFFKKIANVQIKQLTRSVEKKSAIQHHVLQGIMTLRLISAHGRDLLKEKDLERLRGISPSDAIDLDEDIRLPKLTKRAAYESLNLMAEAELDLCKQCYKKVTGESTGNSTIEDRETSARCYVLPCFDMVCSECFDSVKENFDSQGDSYPIECPFCSMTVAAQYVSFSSSAIESLDVIPDDDAEETLQAGQPRYNGPHTKTKALLRDIAEMNEQSQALVEAGEPPIKCVIFSEFTSHLSLIEKSLKSNGHAFVRIDGSMSLNQRKKVLDALALDDDVTILLASIKAAGQGLNLTAASRAFIMEPMWNPAAEAQAVDRIYRIGQKREVIIKRYQMADSIELKIVELQKRKQALADVSMNQNHKQLSKKEVREQHMKEILALFK